MTFFFMTVSGGYVESYGAASAEVQTAVSEETYNLISERISEKPAAPDGFAYKLRADTLEWELVELPPMPEPELTDEEVLEILLGGAAE